MSASEAVKLAADLCARFEGYRAKPYLCPAGVPTIGYGTTRYEDGRAVSLSDPAIGQATAFALMQQNIARLVIPVLKYCPSLSVASSSRLAAILDWTYNLGTGRLQASTLRQRINQQDWNAAADELRKWVRGGGQILPGLVARRDAEIRLLLCP